MAEAQKSRGLAGFRSVRGVSLLFTLMCFFCFASTKTNTVSLEKVKANHQEATQRMKCLTTSHKRLMAFHQGWTGEFKRTIHTLKLEDEEFFHSPPFVSFLNSSMQKLKDLDEYIQNLESQMNETEKELELQGRIIQCLDSQNEL